MKADALAERCKALKLILSDVDGVLTDGTVLLLPDGREGKMFHIRDGMGIVLAHRAGLRTGLVSGRRSEAVERRASELGMAILVQGVDDKRAALQEILERERLEPHEVAYMGDDVADLPVITEVGISAAPADAPMEVRNAAFMITTALGGRGCLREFIEAILKARGDWDGLLAAMNSGPPRA
jgi:3-deoxy-D-manno-octulosonate 8-phosphate phosphatase (KDO 8-P phosphatase)